MASVHDVAAYILREQGAMTAMKLQKLCYYSHAWHLVWETEALFPEEIQAWANGPVAPALYRTHRGRLNLHPGDLTTGDPDRLSEKERSTVASVLGYYGDREAHWLSELTHREDPWRDARTRAGLAPMDRGDAVINDADMYEYYDSLTGADDA